MPRRTATTTHHIRPGSIALHNIMAGEDGKTNLINRKQTRRSPALPEAVPLTGWSFGG
jgi:hypothetical protein